MSPIERKCWKNDRGQGMCERHCREPDICGSDKHTDLKTEAEIQAIVAGFDAKAQARYPDPDPRDYHKRAGYTAALIDASDDAHPQAPVATQPTLEQIRGAVARGWCSPANAAKEMDADLALAIADEVAALACIADTKPADDAGPLESTYE